MGQEEHRQDGGVGGHGVADPGVPVAGADSGTAVRRSLESFLEQRLAAEWYAGQPLGVGESVSGVINRFSPRSVPPCQWARIEGLVRDSVRRADPSNGHLAEAYLNVVTQLAVWVDTIGQPLTRDVVFDPETVDRFVLQGLPGMAPGTQNNYRSQLRTVGWFVLGPEVYPPPPLALPRPKALAPYSPSEVAAIRSWARGLPTRHYRDNMGVILSLGLGAGLHSQEINKLVGTDVTAGKDGVDVHVIGERDRSVPVLRVYEEEVSSWPDGPERGRSSCPTGPASIASRCPTSSLGAPPDRVVVPTRIVCAIPGSSATSAGAHLSALAEAAGVRPDQLVRYQGFAARQPRTRHADS